MWKLHKVLEKQIKLTSRVSCDLKMSSVRRLLNSPRPQSAIYNEPPPVFLDSHPSRSIPKSPVYSSTPDLAKIGSTGSSSDSLNQDHGVDHHMSYENIPIKKNDLCAPLQVHPSARYEWKEPFYERSCSAAAGRKKITGVSEGYCQLHVLNDSKTDDTFSSTGDYSVLNIDAIELPSRDSDASDDESIPESVKNHHYFTLEVCNEQSQQRTGTDSTLPEPTDTTKDSDGSLESIPEAEGDYFTSEEIKTTEETTSPGDQAGVYSYVELDLLRRGISSAPALVCHSKKNTSKEAKCIGDKKPLHHPPVNTNVNRASKVTEENAYDCLRHSAIPSLPVSVAFPHSRGAHVSSGHCGKLNSRDSTQPQKTHKGPTYPKAPYSASLLAKKRECNSVSSTQDEYSHHKVTARVKNSRSSSTGITTHSPSLSHDYDKIRILEDTGPENSEVHSDDDVPLSPSLSTPPLTPGPLENSSRKSSIPQQYNNLVQVMITENGPVLIPRQRSRTMDSETLKQLHRRGKPDTPPRSVSATGNRKNK